MDNSRLYHLFLADWKRSTALTPTDNTALQSNLRAVLTDCNQRYADDLAAPFEINYGDEFGALFETPANIPEIAFHIHSRLREWAQFRFSVSYGRVGVAAPHLREMGGPVFVTADAALKRLKKQGRFCEWNTDKTAADKALSALMNAHEDIIYEMTDYQYAVYSLHHSGMSGVDIADQLDKNPKSVSAAKIAGRADLAIELERAAVLLARDQT